MKYIEQILDAIETDGSVLARLDAIRSLRKLGLEDFGQFFISLPNTKYPKLSSLLPKMADETIQKNWTGAYGLELLKQTTSFVRSVSHNFCCLTGGSLNNKNILDYGCGYGRISRIMYYFTDETNVFGCDPWDKSIETCRQDGLGENYHLSEYMPKTLPVAKQSFDLIYAFSVFTHLSESATITALSTLRKYIREDGILVITIRPIEYWPFVAKKIGEHKVQQFYQDHIKNGFSFYPHGNKALGDGADAYGDTSMTTQWLSINAPMWKIESIDRSFLDSLQLYIFMRPI